MSINFPKNPSTDDNYTYLATSWKYNGVAWEKSAATETGNAEGNTGEVAFYPGLGSDIRGATAFFYGGAGIGIGTSGPTELLDVRGGNIKVDGGITAEKLNIGDDGAFFSASITVAEAVKADEILITNNGADTLNRWTNSTGLTVTNGITAGGGIYAAGGVTLGSNVNVGGDLTVGGDIIMTDIETIKIGGDTEHIAFNGAGAEINVRANELSIDHYLQHFGDNNTHLEFQTDQITLSAGGVDAIDIVPTQVHFGVGITADGGIYAAGGITAGGVIYASGGLTSDRLHVSGETVFNGTVTAISAGDVALNLVADSDNSGENDNPIISMGQDGALARFDLGIVGDAGQIFTNSLSNAAFLDTANSFNDLQFSVAGDAKMTILDSGNVGIGTNAPAKKLDVVGSMSASQGITSDTLQVASGATFGGTVHFDTDTRFHGDIVMNEDGQIKVDGDGETIKLNFSGGILDISANNVDIAKKLRHRGDPDTYLEFTPDTVKFYAGNTNNIILTASETNFSDTEVTRPKLKDYSETALATSTKSASFDVDFEDGNVQSFTFSDDLTVSFENPPATGTAGTVTLIITNGGANTTTWHSNVYWPGNVAPSLTSSGVDIVSFVTIDAGTKIYGFVGGLNFLNS